VYLLFWSYSAPRRKGDQTSSTPLTLEELVTKPQRYEARRSRSRGQFAGRTSSATCPRRVGAPADWVLKDDVFSCG